MKRISVALVLVLLLGACGSDDDDPVKAGADSEQDAGADTGDEKKGSDGFEVNGRTKPEVEVPDDDPPTELVIEDLEEGEGESVKPGYGVSVHYVGVAWSTGEEFDASWDRQEALPFVVGRGDVIRGWDEGLVGMKVGGRRKLVIPPDLAYGSSGIGPIGPDETLVFVVDLVEAEPPPSAGAGAGEGEGGDASTSTTEPEG